MFQQFKNLDTAFKHVRLFSIAFLTGAVIISLYTIYRSTATLQKGQQKIYVLFNGKLIDAMAIDRSDSLSVELRDHIKMFHYYFYSLQPDEQVNKKHVTSALYLADNSAQAEYDNLSENGYYQGIISGNISQEVNDYDSIKLDINRIPYYFRYYGKMKLVRSTSIITRSLITEGYIRTTAISNNNPHGLLIERWRVLANQDLTSVKR